MNQILQAFEARNLEVPTEVAEFDKAIDGCVFNIGKLGKMNLTQDQIERGFKAVNEANMRKLEGPKDAKGKQLKPEGWTGPEEALQAILDER
jgi:predicted HAD superfamily Cof-like phosphohydrolase